MDIFGAKELSKRILKEIKTQGYKDAVKRSTAEMQEQAQRLAPVDTGYLRRNIRSYILDNGLTGIVADEAPYAIYQEFGTIYQSGTPHMRPAFIRQADIFAKDIKAVTKWQK